MRKLVSVPILGMVGTGVEQLFCKRAHAHARGEIVDFACCPGLNEEGCELTGDQHACLFDDLKDPLWADIRQAEAHKIA